MNYDRENRLNARCGTKARNSAHELPISSLASRLPRPGATRLIAMDSQPGQHGPAFGPLTGLKGPLGRKVAELIPGIREANPELFQIYGRVAAACSRLRGRSFTRPIFSRSVRMRVVYL